MQIDEKFITFFLLALQTDADVVYSSGNHEEVHEIRIRSSGDRAVVSGATWRGFESLRMCFYFAE